MGEPSFYSARSNVADPFSNGFIGIRDGIGDVEISRNADAVMSGPDELTFTIPIYSGILGILMPDKKLLPLSLMPLEVEFTLNPHAFYVQGEGITNRNYRVTRFDIYGHMLQFEQ